MVLLSGPQQVLCVCGVCGVCVYGVCVWACGGHGECVTKLHNCTIKINYCT